MPKNSTVRAEKTQKSLRLQWHITDRCNWRCKHCYHEKYAGDELSLAELQRVFQEYEALIKKRNMLPQIKVIGGEPFMRTDLIDFLAHISAAQSINLHDCQVLTNGSLLTDQLLDELKQRAPLVRALQFGVEGDEAINDSIRGKGAFASMIESAARAKKHGFRVGVALTLSQLNYAHVTDLLSLLAIYNMPLLLRRFVPLGQGLKLKNILIPPKKLQKLFAQVHTLNQHYFFTNTQGEKKALLNQYSCMNGIQFFDATAPTMAHSNCDVRNHKILTIMPNGDVYPCRLLPITIGNVQRQSLEEIYDSAAYLDLTKTDQQDTACKKCTAYSACQGGAMCLSHAVTGSVYTRDPQCWAPQKK